VFAGLGPATHPDRADGGNPAAYAAASDASLIDELPYAAVNLTDAPEHVKAGLYGAFDIHALGSP
jgi:hypothetical protein